MLTENNLLLRRLRLRLPRSFFLLRALFHLLLPAPSLLYPPSCFLLSHPSCSCSCPCSSSSSSSSSMDIDDDDDDDFWVCNACTFHNSYFDQSCSMCHTLRPGFLSFLPYFSRSFSFSRFLRNLLSCSLTTAFALVSAFAGSIAGAFAGCAARSGFFRGAGLGAVAGAALSVEILDASRNYWLSHHSDSGPRPSLIDFVEDLFNGRFVREFVVPAISATQQWQLNFTDMSYEELYENIIPEGRLKGASEEFLKSLPQHTVTQCNRMDAYGDVMCCAICLQELEEEDIVRRLPVCNHTFHLNCVDKWLVRHVICPICRQSMH